MAYQGGAIRVFVYFNLHKKCFSIKALEGERKGLVIAHRDLVILTKCKFKVSEAGRQRVLREKKKNVHAGVTGLWGASATGIIEPAELYFLELFGRRVTYNPYKYDSFVIKTTEQSVDVADVVGMNVFADAEGIKRGAIYMRDFK
jgi:hypothetical protein